MKKQQTYWIAKSPTGKYYASPQIHKCLICEPNIACVSYADYLKKFKKLGWKRVKVKLVEVRK